MDRIQALDAQYIPRENEFDFRVRAKTLVKKWQGMTRDGNSRLVSECREESPMKDDNAAEITDLTEANIGM
jgi:hypothetical protein